MVQSKQLNNSSVNDYNKKMNGPQCSTELVSYLFYFPILDSFNTEDYIEGQRSKIIIIKIKIKIKIFIHKFNFSDLDRIIVEGRALHFLMVHGKKEKKRSFVQCASLTCETLFLQLS